MAAHETDRPPRVPRPDPPRNTTLGRRGEELAAAYLSARGMIIVDRNWRCRDGELDIVAMDGPTLVVCEVKTRASRRAGTALESITSRKLRRLHRLAGQWCAQRGGQGLPVRIDGVGIHLDRDGGYTVEHVRGIC